MCIIFVKPAGVDVPDHLHDTINKMIRGNRDGNGFGIRRDKAIRFDRGLYSSIEIMKRIEDIGLKSSDDFIFHARIRTQGSVSLKNCHPFPLVLQNWKNNMNISRVNEWSQVPLLAHNGGFRNFNADRKEDVDASDTYLFARDFISFFDLMSNPEGHATILSYLKIYSTWSKVALLHPRTGIHMFGDFIKGAMDECYYSHSGYASAFQVNPRDSQILSRVNPSSAN